ncbi:MAG: ATP-dependent Clp protease ATP-binding subunit, partial [Elusimicrobia bacterium]|nr:ATP-dependent Clp protease ATP-binding subunit [Elusimicrobiota bacterium]
ALVRLNCKVVLFIDEAQGLEDQRFHILVQMMLEPLARAEISVIFSTTEDGYRKLEKNKSLVRRTSPVWVYAPAREEAIEILRARAIELMAHHRVIYGDVVIEAAIDMAEKYIKGRHLPDSAIDLLDQAAAKVRMRTPAQVAPPTVNVQDIAQVVSGIGKVPVADLTVTETERLKSLPNRLKARVVGQDHAIDEVVDALTAGRLGVSEGNRPIASFIVAGPSGVGKTELARALSKEYFGTDDFLRVDCSELKEPHSVAKLLGSPPGYVGYSDPGRLEPLRQKPYQVVLVDELEEAHPEVIKIFLQAMDDGYVMDSQGRRIDFTNAILLMTTNIGGQTAIKSSGSLGFIKEAPSASAHQALYEKAIRAKLEPKFFNRLDGIIVFNPLSRDNLIKIRDNQLRYLNDRLAASRLSVSLTEAAQTFLLDRGYDPALGARPLKRAINDLLQKPISRGIRQMKWAKGDALEADVNAGKTGFDFKKTGQFDASFLARRERGGRASIEFLLLLPLMPLLLPLWGIAKTAQFLWRRLPKPSLRGARPRSNLTTNPSLRTQRSNPIERIFPSSLRFLPLWRRAPAMFFGGLIPGAARGAETVAGNPDLSGWWGIALLAVVVIGLYRFWEPLYLWAMGQVGDFVRWRLGIGSAEKKSF